MSHNDSFEKVVSAYEAGRISRRDFVRQGVVLGLSMPTIIGVMAACAGDEGEKATPGKRGGTLVEGYDLDFSRMDPIATTWYDPGFFALYDAAITTDTSGNYVPQLAEKWDFSEDGLTATFSIRKGVTFHSGRRLTARAIKEVYDTIADPESGSPLRALWLPVRATEAPDDTTLVIKLKHPFFDLLNVVKSGYWRIVNIKMREKLGEAYGKQKIDGSGPFTFGEWVPGSHVTVERWENYPGSSVPYFENKGKAYLDGIRWVTILEATQRASQIEAGEINTLRGPAFQDIERLKGNPDLNVIELKEWSGYVLGLNFERKDLDFDDLRVRQAVSHAIDREAIVESLFFGHGEPLYGPVTSADKAYTPEVEKFNQFDLEKAKQLMVEAGWESGTDGILSKNGVRQEFEMVIQAETFNKDIAAALQAQLRELGMEVRIQALDRATFFNELFAGPDSFLFFYLWPTPIDVVVLQTDPEALAPAGPNWSRGVVPQVAEAIRAWKTAATEEELIEAGRQFQLAEAEYLVLIPIVNRRAFWVHRKEVHGWLPHQWNLYPYYNDVWLE